MSMKEHLKKIDLIEKLTGDSFDTLQKALRVLEWKNKYRFHVQVGKNVWWELAETYPTMQVKSGRDFGCMEEAEADAFIHWVRNDGKEVFDKE
jgi:predicted transcriptional regulator